MNIYNKNWAHYEYSYNLANSCENWAQKKKNSFPTGCRRPMAVLNGFEVVLFVAATKLIVTTVTE